MAREAGTAVPTLIRHEAAERRRLPWYVELWLRLVREKPLGTVGLLIVVGLVLTAVFADVIARTGPNDTDLANARARPSWQHPFGTDQLGRDLFSRVVYGARVSMYVGLGAVALGVTMAVLLGTVSAYIGGLLDMLLQRIVDAWLSIPTLVFLLAMVSVLKPSLGTVIFSLALLMTFSNSRVIRASVLAIMAMPYVEAARALGAGHLRVVLRHILPNVVAPIIVIATLGLGSAILAEAALSFLGFGVPPPAPAWGGMLSGSARQYIYLAPWLGVFPGLAIALAVFGFNMLGDALRDLLDPRLRRGR
jgi:peptide/nickel transport system permease protein